MMTATETKERPVLFSSQMIRAIVAGRKFQTRRIIKPAPPNVDVIRKMSGSGFSLFSDSSFPPDIFRVTGPVWAVRDSVAQTQWKCPYGAPGDMLWVRESHSFSTNTIPIVRLVPGNERFVKRTWYAADNDRPTWAETKWRPSIHMPRWASRLTLKITATRAEPLQSITEADAQREGFEQTEFMLARRRFELLWGELNGPASWDANPWVWVIEFSPVLPTAST